MKNIFTSLTSALVQTQNQTSKNVADTTFKNNMKFTRATYLINSKLTTETTTPHLQYSCIVTICGHDYAEITEDL